LARKGTLPGRARSDSRPQNRDRTLNHEALNLSSG
jgi:hypothetical protein